MISSAYIQIVPIRRRDGSVRDLKLQNLTQGPPASPEPGALVMKLNINVDPDVFAIPTATVMVAGDPKEVEAAVAPYPIPVVEEDTDA